MSTAFPSASLNGAYNNMPDNQKINQLLEKVEKLKKEGQLDLSSDEDLSIAIMNLVSIEEHFFFTASKTGKEKYFDMLFHVREIRKELLARIVKNPEGEEWCISKHLLAASMRLIEVGTKYLTDGKKEEAQSMFSKAYDLYSLFWGINLKLIDIGEVKAIDEDKINVHDKSNGDLMEKLNDLVQKLIDCCKE